MVLLLNPPAQCEVWKVKNHNTVKHVELMVMSKSYTTLFNNLLLRGSCSINVENMGKFFIFVFM